MLTFKQLLESSKTTELMRLKQELGEVKRELRDARNTGDDDDVIDDLNDQKFDLEHKIRSLGDAIADEVA